MCRAEYGTHCGPSNPDSPPSPFYFHPSTRDFSYSCNKHLLNTYCVPESYQRLRAPQSSERDRYTTHTPGFVLFRDRAPQQLGLESHRPGFKSQLYHGPAM